MAKVGDIITLKRDVDSLTSFIKMGSKVKIIAIDEYRGYGVQDLKTGARVLEIGWSL